MKRLLLPTCIICLMLLSACGGNPPVQDPYTTREIQLPAFVGAADTLKATGPTISQQPLPVAKSTGGLNPEHGKPGHRCDIAVGAPLSAPVQSVPMQTTNQSQSLPALPAQSNAAPAMGALNPEHGKPNHRCDIAVGAPLSSPVQSVPLQTPAQTLPALPQPAGNASGTARLNPAHGQPGHDCAIPVGKPLKS